MRHVQLALAACAAFVLTACGSSADEPLFPLADGHAWSYRMTMHLDDPALPVQEDVLELRAEGEVLLAGKPVWRRRSADGMTYWLRRDADGIARVASRGPLEAAPRLDPVDRFVLRKPYVAGTSWQADTTTYVLQRRNEFPRELRHLERYRSLTMRYRIEQTGLTVQVPAGRFENCLMVRGIAGIYLYVDDQLAFREVPLTTHEWYCPGPGLVKQERLEPAPSKFLLGGRVLLELVDWR